MRSFGRKIFPCIFALTTVVMAASGPGVRTADAQALESEALGLTRTEFEAAWGPATEQVEMPGQYGSDELFLHGAEDAMIYVSYREFNSEQIVIYVELNWLGDGVSEDLARETIERLLPGDATLTELYTSPPTPDGPIALSMYRYISDSLGEVHSGVLASEILVLEQHAWNEAAGASTIMSISLMIRERTQITN